MPNINDIHKLVGDLHDRKIINADTSMKELLATNAGTITSPGEAQGWYIAGGDHFVIVCGKEIGEKVINPANKQR